MILLFGGKGIWIAPFASELIVFVLAKNILETCKDNVEKKYTELKIV
jgi:hypothetical protein